MLSEHDALDVVAHPVPDSGRLTDKSGQPFAEFGVVDAHHGGLDDVGMVGKKILDFEREDFSPPETIMSSSRPSMNHRPVSSKCPVSPVDSRPSTISFLPPSV